MNRILWIGTFMCQIMFSSCLSDKNPLLRHADKQFSDQSFKTAISLIELHNLRYGEYPVSIDSLTFVGGWGMLHDLEYIRHEEGYELNVTESVMTGATPALNYSDDFWQNLGLIKSNIKE